MERNGLKPESGSRNLITTRIDFGLHPLHRGAPDWKCGRALAECLCLLHHPFDDADGRFGLHATFIGQPHQVGTRDGRTFTTHVHVMLPTRAIAERQIECGSQTSASVPPKTPLHAVLRGGGLQASRSVYTLYGEQAGRKPVRNSPGLPRSHGAGDGVEGK